MMVIVLKPFRYKGQPLHEGQQIELSDGAAKTYGKIDFVKTITPTKAPKPKRKQK